MVRKLLILLFPLLVVAACDSVQYRTDDNYSYLTITLSAEDTSRIIEGLLTGGTPPLMRTANAELRDGTIFVQGDVNDGRGGTVPGSLSMRIWVEGEALRAAISQLSFGGFVADQQLINRVNSDIAAGLASAAANNDNGSIISQVSLSANGLQFTIRTPR